MGRGREVGERKAELPYETLGDGYDLGDAARDLRPALGSAGAPVGVDHDHKVVVELAQQLTRQRQYSLEAMQRQRSSSCCRSLKSTLWNKWNASPGTWSFLFVELIKVGIVVASFYGAVSYATWDACGLPDRHEHTSCDINYADLRVREIAFCVITGFFVALLRQQRRKHEVKPNLLVNKRLAHYLSDDSHANPIVGAYLLEHVVDLVRAEDGDDSEGLIQKIDRSIESIKYGIRRHDDRLMRIEEARMKPTCYSYANEAVRIAVGAFLGGNFALQFCWMLSTLSGDSAYKWGETPLSHLGFLGWGTVVLGMIGGAMLLPDDMATSTRELKDTIVHQYGRLLEHSRAYKKAHLEEVKRSIKQIDKRLDGVDLGDAGSHGDVSPQESQLLSCKMKLIALKRQLKVEICADEQLYSDHGVVDKKEIHRGMSFKRETVAVMVTPGSAPMA